MKASAFQRGLLIGVALLVGMPLSATAKCRGPGPTGRPMVVIDGRQYTEAELAPLNLDADATEAVHIYCWNPADSTFAWSHGPQGVAAGFGVIRVVTTRLVDRLIAELYRVAEGGAGGPPIVRAATDEEIVVERTADGMQWSATLQVGAMVHRCVLDAVRPTLSTEIQRSCVFSIAQGEKFVMSTEG